MPRDSVDSTVQRIRRKLSSTVRFEVNQLGAACNASTETLVLRFDLPRSIAPGAVLAIDNELMRVVSANVASREVSVLRGWQDSVAVSHADRAEVQINPRFTMFDIFDTMQDEISSWAPDLYRVTTEEFTTADGDTMIEVLNPKVYGVVEARRHWSHQNNESWPVFQFAVQRGGPSWSAANGTGVFVRITSEGGRFRSGAALLSLAVPFDVELLTMDSRLADFGIDNGLLELIELGVRARLVNDDEIGRSQRLAQDTNANAEQVPPGAAQASATMLWDRYNRRRAQETQRLRARYPFRSW